MSNGALRSRHLGKALAVALAAVVTGGLTACADVNEGGTPAAGGDGEPQNAKVAFLMPDIASTRYELADRPLFEAKVKQLCAGCGVVYANANSDAAQQQQQANSALAQGVKAIVLDPVDSTAAATIVTTARAQGVPVIAYDRPIPDVPADYYISFDNEAIGAMIAKSPADRREAGRDRHPQWSAGRAAGLGRGARPAGRVAAPDPPGCVARSPVA
ncbi:MAG TPA: substrate-binding domain-containing protein [Pseudonocardia sp.]